MEEDTLLVIEINIEIIDVYSSLIVPFILSVSAICLVVAAVFGAKDSFASHLITILNIFNLHLNIVNILARLGVLWIAARIMVLPHRFALSPSCSS